MKGYVMAAIKYDNANARSSKESTNIQISAVSPGIREEFQGY